MKTLKRLIFPVINALIFALLFAVVGYYVFDPLRWTLVGAGIGFGIGALIEFGLGLLGGWIYRRRVTLTVLIEIVLVLTVIGPFIYFYATTPPVQHTVCCIENSGLGDQVEAVQIPVADGETLAGWYAPPTDDSGAVVLVLHGSGSDRTAALSHARPLHEAGFGVLVYDQRASGESSGDVRSNGLYDQRDLTPIIDWLATRPEVNLERGVGGVGLSLGAHILVMAAPDEPRLSAIWGDGLGMCSVDDLPAYEGLATDFMEFIDRQAQWFEELYLGVQIVPCKTLIPQIAPRPLMLIAGGETPYEEDFNRGYEGYLGENGEVWVIENANHVGGLWVDDTYKPRMISFFDAALHS